MMGARDKRVMLMIGSTLGAVVTGGVRPVTLSRCGVVAAWRCYCNVASPARSSCQVRAAARCAHITSSSTMLGESIHIEQMSTVTLCAGEGRARYDAETVASDLPDCGSADATATAAGASPRCTLVPHRLALTSDDGDIHATSPPYNADANAA